MSRSWLLPSTGGMPPVMIQYWRSFEYFEAYAKDREGKHYPALKAFITMIKSNGDVGIWHETYKVKAGEYECVYNNMSRCALGKIGELIPAIGRRETAAGRMVQSK